jgi:translation initiation factor 5
VCKLPEINLKIKKDTLKCVCRSCGKTSKLDSSHKIAKYILKNPPTDESEFGKKEDTKKEEKKVEEKKPEEEVKKKIKKDKKKKDEESKSSAEGVKHVEDLSLTSPEILESIARGKDYKNSQKRTPYEIIDQINNIAISQGFKEDTKYYVAMHGLLDEKFLVQWPKESSIRETFKLMVNNDGEKGQCWVFLALQRFIKNHGAELASQANTILKCFYDEEILSEEILLKYYSGKPISGSDVLQSGKTFNKELNTQFKETIRPFVTWLQYLKRDNL